MHSTENNNVKVVGNMLSRGVNPDLYENQSGETPLLVAARLKNQGLVKMYLTQKLKHFDKSSIETKISNINKYVSSDHFNTISKTSMFAISTGLQMRKVSHY